MNNNKKRISYNIYMQDINNLILNGIHNSRLISLIIIHTYNNKIDNMETFFKQLFQEYIDNTYSDGYLYCFYNEMFQFYGDNIYKLGCSTDCDKRKKQYITSYIDAPMFKHISNKLKYCVLAESMLFAELKEYRVKQNREFFNCDLDKIIRTITDIDKQLANEDIYDLFCKYKLTNQKLFNFVVQFKQFFNKHKSLFESLNFSRIDFIEQIELFYRGGGGDGVKNKEESNKLKQESQLKEKKTCFKLLFGKEVECDPKVIEKVNVIKEIINVLGFDLDDLDRVVVKDVFYKNKDKLLTDSQFSRNYGDVRKLFGKPAGELCMDLKGVYLFNMINSYLNDGGVGLKSIKYRKKIKGIRYEIYTYMIFIIDAYKNIIE